MRGGRARMRPSTVTAVSNRYATNPDARASTHMPMSTPVIALHAMPSNAPVMPAASETATTTPVVRADGASRSDVLTMPPKGFARA